MTFDFCVTLTKQNSLSLHCIAVGFQLALPPMGAVISVYVGLGSMAYKVAMFFHNEGLMSVGIDLS